MEAFIDFAEDENIENDVLDQGKSCDYHTLAHMIRRTILQ